MGPVWVLFVPEPGCEKPLIVRGLVIVGRSLPRATVLTPAPAMLKLIVSFVPKAPGLWAVMLGSPRSLPALMAVAASRSETLPSFGVRSSPVVVTVTVAALAEALATAIATTLAASPIRIARLQTRQSAMDDRPSHFWETAVKRVYAPTGLGASGRSP